MLIIYLFFYLKKNTLKKCKMLITYIKLTYGVIFFFFIFFPNEVLIKTRTASTYGTFNTHLKVKDKIETQINGKYRIQK